MMRHKIIMAADLVADEKTGETYRQQNFKIKHAIPLGSMVQVDFEECTYSGIRLIITEHTRDCDGTPLYSIGIPDHIHRIGETTLGQYGGYCDDCLTVISTPKEATTKGGE